MDLKYKKRLDQMLYKPTKDNKKDLKLACLGLTHLKNQGVQTKDWNFLDLFFHGLLVNNKIKLMGGNK